MAAETETSIVILVLIGVPGSGKSTFANNFEKYLNQRSIQAENGTVMHESTENVDKAVGGEEDKDFQIVHVCYDNLIPLEVQRGLVDGPPGRWKEMRADINQAVKHAVARLLNKPEPPTETEMVKQFLSKLNPKAGFKRTLFIIDDNNQLSSMRYSYYQVAREHSLGFAQLYLGSKLHTALALNKLRPESAQVPESVISRMQESLEPPDPFNNAWERFSFTINVQQNVDLNLDMINNVVLTAFKHPEIPLEDRSEEKDKDRVLCSANLVHQADKHLRGLVNKKMKSLKDKDELSKQQMKSASSQFYNAKQEVLEDLKTGFTKLDRYVVEGVESRESGSADQLAAVMADLFQHKLNIQSE